MQSSKSQLKKINADFDKILLQIIDDAFAGISENMGSDIYHYLEKKKSVQKRDVPRKIGLFSLCLEEIFGKETEHLIRMVIVKNLYIKIEEDWEKIEPKSFAGYVNNAREKYVEKNRRKHRKLH